MAACRQSGIHHYVLPKFSKVELCKQFGVKRITAFALKLDGLPPAFGLQIEKELAQFDQLMEPGTADVKKYRYADDSMFQLRSSNELRNCQVKKWTVEIHPKNHKKVSK